MCGRATWYEALGFALDERWEENGTLLAVMLRAGGTQIEVRWLAA